MLEWDEGKREATLTLRGLDFANAAEAFNETSVTLEDVRSDYGEARYQTIGLVGSELILVVWTPRGAKRRIISMRKCNGKERSRYDAETP